MSRDLPAPIGAKCRHCDRPWVGIVTIEDFREGNGVIIDVPLCAAHLDPVRVVLFAARRSKRPEGT